MLIESPAPGRMPWSACRTIWPATGSPVAEVGLNPEKDLYICNAVKCRPPQNRRPKRGELTACRPWLDRQIDLEIPRRRWGHGRGQPAGHQTGMTQPEVVVSWNGRSVMPTFTRVPVAQSIRMADAPTALTRADLNAAATVRTLTRSPPAMTALDRRYDSQIHHA